MPVQLCGTDSSSDAITPTLFKIKVPALMVPWRIYQIHGTFKLDKRYFRFLKYFFELRKNGSFKNFHWKFFWGAKKWFFYGISVKTLLWNFCFWECMCSDPLKTIHTSQDMLYKMKTKLYLNTYGLLNVSGIYSQLMYHKVLEKLYCLIQVKIKLFLMKFESFLTLHRQQCWQNWQVQGPER